MVLDQPPAPGSPWSGQVAPTLDGLVARLSESARSLEDGRGSEETLNRVVRSATGLVPGAAHASISLVTRGRRMRSVAPTGPLPSSVDQIQEDVGQGPCLDAVAEKLVVHVADLAADPRWPVFAERALEAGATSILSFQLFVDGESFGALNLYGDAPHAFDAESEQVGVLVAAHAAIAYARARTHEQLLTGLGTRDLIGQAKGILMERYQIDGDAAFAVLARYSSHSNRRLRDISEELVRTRQLAPPPAPPPRDAGS